MKDVNNNKGFSLVEILATMVILAIVSTIGIVSINSMLTKSRQHFYESQKQQMVLAAQSYVNDNRNILPRNVGGMQKVKLSVLREKNYIKEDIVDQDKKPCDKDKSYVTIYKSSRTDYKYRGYLECPACQKGGSAGTNECYSDSDKLKPTIVITLANPNDVNNSNGLLSNDHKIRIKIQSLDNPSDKPDIKIASYSYKVYVNNVLKTDSGTKIDNRRQELSIVEKLNKYLPGKVKVVVTATNTDGSTTSKTATEDYSDYKNPSCGVVSYEGANPMTAYDSQTNQSIKCGETGYDWININTQNNNRVVWVVCNDAEGIGCAQHEFSQSFTSDGEDDKIFIKDKNGNTDEAGCPVKKCIDTTTSKITLDFYKADSNGKESGKSIHTYTAEPQSSNINYYKAEEHKEWLNKEKFPNGVLVKVKVDEPTSKIKKFTWKINRKNQSLTNVSDAETTIKTKSNLNNNEVTYLITDDGVRKQDITVEDYAGNTVRFVVTLWIDFTAPGVPTVNLRKWANNDTKPTSENGLLEYTNDSWYSGKVFTFASGGADSPNVSGFDHYEYNASGATTDATDKTSSYRNVEAEGTSYVQYKACDKANNCSSYSENSTIKLDRTAPSCSIAGDGEWHKSGAKIITTCTKNDSYSNISTCQGNEYHQTKTNVTYYATDGAGNTSPACTYTVTTGTEHRRAKCSEYKRSYSSCGCETYNGCRRKSFGSLVKEYDVSDDYCSNQSECDEHIKAGLSSWAKNLTDGTYGDFNVSYKRGQDPDGTTIGNTGVSGCTNISTTADIYHIGKKALILTNINKETCHASAVDSGNFWTDGRYYNSKCYLGVSDYYWSCNTASHKKRLVLNTYNWSRDSDCGCETGKRCEDAGCNEWGDWGSWSINTSACNSNSCKSESRTVYK